MFYPKVKLVRPPGGLDTFDVGRSVRTLKELVVLEEAKALLEIRGCLGADNGGTVSLVEATTDFCSVIFPTMGEALVATFFSFSAPV